MTACVTAGKASAPPRDHFPILGALDCVRKPLTFIDGYMLVEPRDKGSEFLSVSIGLQKAAMDEMIGEWAGWKADGGLVEIE